jgi:ATP-dependent RNA helicase DDX24/MAK5
VKAKEVKAKEAQPKREAILKASLSFAALEEAEEDDGVDVSEWDQLGLSPEILTSLSKLKFSTPTTVQKSCIPAILDGHDVVGKASTGSGKTLAFGIPILEHYLEKRGKKEDESENTKAMPMALILSPTRELAHQLAKHIGDLITNAPDADARIALLTGGLSIQKQQRQLANADIVIGTPGRVWEILSTGSGLIRKMQGIKYLVVDEADRLLSEGHFKEVEEILGALDRKEHGDFPDMDEEEEAADEEPDVRQTLVFSATFHRDLQQKLAGKSRWTGGDLMDKKESMEYLLKKLNFREEKPKFIDVNPVQQMAEGLKEGIVECPAMEKVSKDCLIVADELWSETNPMIGSLSVFPSTLLPQAPNPGVYQLYLRRPPSYSIIAKLATPCARPPLFHGSEGPSSLCGAILFPLIKSQFYSCRYRRGSPWSRH